MRDYNICGWFGGEEFAFLLPHITARGSLAGYRTAAPEKISQITVPISSQPDDPAHLGVAISIGAAACTTPAVTSATCS